MSNVPVQKHREEKSMPEQCLEELRKFSDEIRGKAFDLFEKYGRPAGRALEHWLEAEKQLLSTPRSELLETQEGYELRIAAPGFDANEIEVSALPTVLIVRAQAAATRDEKQGELRFSEFSDHNLFRRIEFPAPVDVETVTAKVARGVLTVMAQKAAVAKETERKVSVAGA